MRLGPPPVPRSRPIGWRVFLPGLAGCVTSIISTSSPTPDRYFAKRSAIVPSSIVVLGVRMAACPSASTCPPVTPSAIFCHVLSVVIVGLLRSPTIHQRWRVAAVGLHGRLVRRANVVYHRRSSRCRPPAHRGGRDVASDRGDALGLLGARGGRRSSARVERHRASGGRADRLGSARRSDAPDDRDAAAAIAERAADHAVPARRSALARAPA